MFLYSVSIHYDARWSIDKDSAVKFCKTIDIKHFIALKHIVNQISSCVCGVLYILILDTLLPEDGILSRHRVKK